MTINITVVIQIVNFIVAYLILERIFLRFGMHQVRERDTILRRRHDLLALSKSRVEGLRLEVQRRWRSYQESLQSKTPSVTEFLAYNAELPAREKFAEGEQALTDVEEQKLILELKNKLIKRVLS